MLDQDAINERRNPTTKAQQAKAKQDVKRYAGSEPRKPDQVYALVIGPEDAPIYFYVGIAKNPQQRFQQHLRGIANGADMKEAYEWVRYHKLKDTLRMEVIDAEGEFTEESWRVLLLEEGHPLQNATGGVNVKRKRRTSNDLQKALKGQEQPLWSSPEQLQRYLDTSEAEHQAFLIRQGLVKPQTPPDTI